MLLNALKENGYGKSVDKGKLAQSLAYDEAFKPDRIPSQELNLGDFITLKLQIQDHKLHEKLFKR